MQDQYFLNIQNIYKSDLLEILASNEQRTYLFISLDWCGIVWHSQMPSQALVGKEKLPTCADIDDSATAWASTSELTRPL